MGTLLFLFVPMKLDNPMFEKRVKKGVDQWDHTNAMGQFIGAAITFIPMIWVANFFGGWGWLITPIVWLALLALNWFLSSTETLSEYEARNRMCK